jgi:hypothetical protein
VVVAIALILPLWFVGTIWRERSKRGWRWISKDSRTMYVDAVKAVASASAIAASLVSAITSTAGNRTAAVLISVKFAVVALILSIVGSIFTILALSRGYDRARSRLSESKTTATTNFEQGELNDVELVWILGSAYAGLAGFLVGFLFIGRIVFQN